MDESHVEGKVKSVQNTDILSLFTSLFKEKGKNGKICVSLLKSMQGSGSKIYRTSEYPYKRLVRGLGSSRLNTQCASFATLTSALKLNFISAKDILQISLSLLEASQKSSNSEKVAANISVLLTCGALIHSGDFVDQSAEIQSLVVKKLIEISKTRNYFSFVSYKFLVDASYAVNEKIFKSVVLTVCKKELNFSDDDVNNPDLLYFYLSCYLKHSNSVKKYICKSYDSFESFVEKVVSNLVNFHVKFDHPIYDCLGQILAENALHFANVFSNIIQNIIPNVVAFKDNAVLLLGSLFFKYLKDASIISHILTEDFLAILLRVMAVKKIQVSTRLNFQNNGLSLLKSIVNILSKEDVTDNVRLEIITKIMNFPGVEKFESKTGFKMVLLISQQLSFNGLKKLVKKCKKVLKGASLEKEKPAKDWNNKEQKYIFHFFVKLLNYPITKNEELWKLEEIKYIFEIAFTNSNYPSDVKKYAKDCFYKATELQMGKLKDLLPLLHDLILWIDGKIENNEVSLSETSLDYWKKMIKALKKLNKKTNEEMYAAIYVLLIYVGLKIFTENELAESSIAELVACYSHLQKKQLENVDNELHWTEVTTDLILSLLSRENNLWRHVVSLVFPHIVPFMTLNSLGQILEALDPRSKILKSSAADESESESESEFESEDKKENFENDGNDDRHEGSDSSASDIDEEDDIDDEDEKANDQLRMAVRGALGTSAALTDEESVDMDDMNEEEEERLNRNLSEAFKIFQSNAKSRQKKQTKEEAAVMHFRTRVLDLIEIYISGSPMMDACLEMLIPLFELLEFTIKTNHQKPLQNRVENVLKKLTSVKKFTNSENVVNSTIYDIFKTLIGKKDIPGLIFLEMAPRISECCAFLIRCCESLPDCDSLLFLDDYVVLLTNSFKGKEMKIPNSMFDIVLRCPWKGNWKIVETLFEFLTDESIRIFRKSKVIELLETFYKNDKIHHDSALQEKKNLNNMENCFIQQFIILIDNYEKIRSEITDKVTINFFQNILQLINLIINSSKKYRGDIKPPHWDKLINKMVTLEFLISNKKLRPRLYGLAQRCNVLIIKDVKPLKTIKRERSVSASSVQSNGEEKRHPKKKSKKKNLSEKSKLKKESIKLRETAFQFSSVNLNALSTIYDTEEVSQKKKSLNKKTTKKRKNEVSLNGQANTKMKVLKTVS